MLESNAFIRVLAKRIDVKTIKLTQAEAYEVITVLLDGSERAAVLADLTADPAWRKSAQLYSQTEVLQPNSTNAYSREFGRAKLVRDEADATAIVDRLKRAPKLDTSEAVSTRKDYVAGTSDAKITEDLQAQIARLEPLSAAKGLSAKTQAAVNLLLSGAFGRIATMSGDAEALAKSLTLMRASVKGWSALTTDGEAFILLDQVGLEVAKDQWSKLRRERSSSSALAKLVAANDPVVAKIKAHAAWAQIGPLLRTMVGKPTLNTLRLARITGDADAIAKATPVLDDKLVRLDIEFEKIAEPGQDSTAEDLAFLDKR